MGLVASARAESLTYVLTPQPADGRLRVELEWQTHGRTQSVLMIQPHWASVRDVPSLVKDVLITPADDLQHEGTRWTVSHPADAKVKCRYDVVVEPEDVAWERDYCPIVGRDYVHAIGETFLITPPDDQSDKPTYDVTVRWNLPTGWGEAVSPIGSGSVQTGKLDISTLRQMVYMAGKLAVASRNVMGRPVTVAMTPRFAFKLDEFADLCERIIKTERQFLDDQSFPPYLVTAVAIGKPMQHGSFSMSGTGLHHSFATFLPPQTVINDGVQHLLAHELFHNWNGRVLGREPPEELLYWFSEGLTEYYSLRVLFESGLWDATTYAKWVNRHLAAYQGNPARNATNEQIQQEFWSKRQSTGEVAYQRGLLLGLRWHDMARRKGKAGGIDSLFKTLLRQAEKENVKLSNDRIRETGTKVLGEWFAEEFDRYVVQAETISLPDSALGTGFVGKNQTMYAFEPGFDQTRTAETMRVVGLVKGSAAEKAGLREDDKLAGLSLYSDAAHEAEVKVRREGKVQSFKYFPRGKEFETIQFEPVGAAASRPAQ